ncbi:MAG: immunoglobulin domain-containing protein [Candidatus Kapabacteria bacterium]|nr:immunoglobulin domain-containing protein [Candidatus Kapabacteria bacterium]
MDIIEVDNTLYRCGYVHASARLPTDIPHVDMPGEGFDFLIVRMNRSGDSIYSWARIGGGQDDRCRRVRRLRDGKILVAGTTESGDFPAGRLRSSTDHSGGIDCAFAILDATLTGLERTRVFGGVGIDIVEDVDILDETRFVFCGSTTTRNLPTTVPPVYRINPDKPFERSYYAGGTHLGGQDAFAAVLDVAGNVLHCRYFGSAGTDAAKGIKVLGDNTIAMTGSVGGTDFQTLPLVLPGNDFFSRVPFQTFSRAGSSDAFVVRMSIDLTTTDSGLNGPIKNFCSYLGGSAADVGVGVGLAQNGDLLICGHTMSADITTDDRIQGERGGSFDIFIARVTIDGQRLVQVTYHGGSGNEYAFGSMTHPSVRGIGIVGSTSSMNFPCLGMSTPCEQRGSTDAFASLFDDNTFTASTLIGSDARDSITGATMNGSGDIYVTVQSSSPAIVFPTFGAEPSLAHAACIVPGAMSSTERPPLVVCPDGVTEVSWSSSNMRASDRYAMLVRTDVTPWRNVNTSISGRTFTFSVRDLPLGTYAARIVCDRGPFIDIPTAFVISPTRQISLSIQTDTLCTGDRPVVWFNDNQSHGDTVLVSINDSLPTTIAMLENAVASLSAGRYIIRAWTKRGCDQSAVSTSDTIVLISRPSIISHPQSVTAPANAKAILSIEAKGNNLEFQWRRNGVAIAGAVEPRLVLPKISAPDEGDYTCEVSNHCGTIESDVASVRLSTVSVQADGSSHDVVLFGNTIEPRPLADNVRCAVEIHDLLGRTVIRTVDVSLPWSIPLMTPGLYLVRLSMDTKTICLPLIR